MQQRVSLLQILLLT